jgi:predicted metal-dependent peptidase
MTLGSGWDLEARRKQALELLAGDRAALLVRQPFLALLALQLELVPVSDARLFSIATDGQQLFCDVELMLRQGVAERQVLLAHSVWHAALLHPWRRGSRQRWAWDLASDHEVNVLIEPEFTLGADQVWFPERAGESAEEVYSWLLHCEAKGERMPERGALADLHLDPDGVLDPPEPVSDSVIDPAFRPIRLAGGLELWTERLLGAAQQLRARGVELPSAVARLVEELRRPRVSWRQVLAEFVASVSGDHRQFLPPNRRYLHRSLYLPRRRAEKLRLTVALDTSFSTRSVQTEFFSEFLAMITAYDDYELSLIQGDDAVRALAVYSRERPFDPQKVEAHGLGGTDFRPIFRFLEQQPERPRGLVFLTDGHGQAPAKEPSYPVLWALCAGGEAPARWGRVLRIGD